MWHDHDIDFARWLHPAMWHVSTGLAAVSVTGRSLLLRLEYGTVFRRTWENRNCHTASSGGLWRHFIRTVRPRRIVNCLIAPSRNILTYLLTYLLTYVALESWQWIHQVAAPCSVTRSSGIMTLNSPGGSTCNVAGGSVMTCQWIRPDVHHIGTLHLVSISTTSPQLTSFCTRLQNFI